MTHNSSPPPPRPGLIYRLFRGYRAGRLIVILIALAACLGTILNDSTNSSQPTSSVDTLTITLTWDQWSDIQNAAKFIQDDISLTLKLAGDTLSPSTIEQSHAVIEQFKALENTVIDQAEAQTTHIPNDELNAILDHQLQRQRDLVDLLIILDDAWLDSLTPKTPPTAQPTQPAALYERDNCTPWSKAAAHLGQNTCVYGDVYSTHDSGKAYFINFSAGTSDFYAVSFDWTWKNLENICVVIYGTISTYEGRPQIIIDDRDQLQDCYP